MTTLVEGVATVDDVEGFVDELEAIGEGHGATVQAFDAAMVVDRTHLERAVELADRSIERGENVARDRGVEIMLNAAGRRQIDQALAMGVGDEEMAVVILVDGGDETAAAADVREVLDEERATLGEYDDNRVREYFDISEAELAAVDGTLEDLVHERVALLTIER